MKKMYLLLLSAILITAANAESWDGSSAAWTQGDGSENNPYLIENGRHLAYLSEKVREGETYEGLYFRLTDNLDMGADNEKKFTPIGFFNEYIDTQSQGGDMIDSSCYFMGIFDGNHKIIDNIHVYYVDPNPDNSVGGTGLFACITKNAEIKNLTIGENSIIEGADATGAFVGAMNGGKIINCCNQALLTIVREGPYGAGGITGNNTGGIISGCCNMTNITGHNNVGGIVGFIDKSGTVENCYNAGMVTFGGFFAGGISGYLASGTVKNCYNRGSVLNDYSGQAVIGTTDKSVTIENCYYLNIPNAATDDNTGVTAKEEADMKEAGFPGALNNGQNVWVADTKNLNDGFPVLAWQINPDVSVTDIRETMPGIYAVGHSVYVQSDHAIRITVTDISGKTVVNKALDNGVLHIADNGLYLVTVFDGNGQKHTLKIIIK